MHVSRDDLTPIPTISPLGSKSQFAVQSRPLSEDPISAAYDGLFCRLQITSFQFRDGGFGFSTESFNGRNQGSGNFGSVIFKKPSFQLKVLHNVWTASSIDVVGGCNKEGFIPPLASDLNPACRRRCDPIAQSPT